MGVYEDAQVADAKWRVGIDRDIKELKDRADDHFERLEQHDALFAAGDKRMSALSEQIAANTRLTEAVKADTAKIVKAYNDWGGFTTVSKWIAALIIGAGGLVLAGGVLYWLVSTGTLPRPPGYQPAPPAAASPKT